MFHYLSAFMLYTHYKEKMDCFTFRAHPYLATGEHSFGTCDINKASFDGNILPIKYAAYAQVFLFGESAWRLTSCRSVKWFSCTRGSA